MPAPRLRRMLLAALTLGLAACAPAASQPAPGAGSRAAHNDTSTPFTFVSVPALIEHRYDGRDLRLGEVVSSTVAFTQRALTYRSGDLTISGLLTLPNRTGPHPLVVLAHGYIPPERYPRGGGLLREQAYLAGRGFAVLLPDYRNHLGSDRDGSSSVRRPLGYPEDLVNAVRAIRAADLPPVDSSRVGVLGRSMGGGVALTALVAVPDLFDAAVLYAPVSSRADDVFRRWVSPVDAAALHRKVAQSFGLPTDRPQRWRRASARTYLDRVESPVQVHHGTADPVCPLGWSRDTVGRLQELGKDAELVTYPGEDHRFDAQWPQFIRRSADFLDAHLH